MSGRSLLDEIGEAVLAARRLRFLPADAFDDLSADELERVGRGLARVVVDCEAGVRTIERALAQRSSVDAG